MSALVEVVCCSADDCVAAENAGAGRIELCSAIELGGLTPSLGVLLESRARVQIPTIAMVRPRAAGFFYSDAEFRTMLRDVELLRAHGAEGAVFGVLHRDGSVDVERNALLVEAAASMQTVFHRAFDATPDPLVALEGLVAAGFTRVLTSGQAASAAEGRSLIAELVQRARGRIEILPGGGLRAGNLREVAALVNQVHLGPFSRTLDPSTSARPGVSYGVGEMPPENTYGSVDVAEIEAAVRALGH